MSTHSPHAAPEVRPRPAPAPVRKDAPHRPRRRRRGVVIASAATYLLLTRFLQDFPEEIEQAAVMDGVGLWRMAWKVVFPLMRPVVATLAILNVIYVWNEFPFAVTLINDPALTTVSLGVSQFQGVYSVDYGAMMVSAIQRSFSPTSEGSAASKAVSAPVRRTSAAIRLSVSSTAR
ncbi:Binding-protein-dependent transport system inner membrane component [Streptomyces sp. MnatMP-M17]|nr:ABC transporter permease subunit [Streptomyces sp. SID4917]SCF83777.1 Binding-protein-dependent transport system inner membrane component [Streptomyces sp. MnatMP-M17]